MVKMHFRVTFIEPVLGTTSNNKELFTEYIASKAPDSASKEEEVAAFGVDATVEKSMTIFPKLEDGTPFLWDYQIKGFFKDSCSALQRCKAEELAKESCKLRAFKKVIDGCIFPQPRKIPINIQDGEISTLQRPLRANTPQGERVSIAISECVPAGSTAEFDILCLSKEYEKAILEWMEYGILRGFLQWRNAGYGRFVYELLDDDGNVIGGNKGESSVA